MRYDSEHKQRTRERVLKAAAKAIRAQGPHKVGVAEVMSQAGLTHGGFYAHFASKDALIAAAIEEMFTETRERFAAEIVDLPPAEAMSHYIDRYLSARHRDARRSGCPIAALSSDLPRLGKSALARFSEGAERMRSSIAAMLEKLGREDAGAEASSVQAELVGALSLARVEPDAKRSDAILADSRRAIKRRLALEH